MFGGEDLDRRVGGQAVVEDDYFRHAPLEVGQRECLVDLAGACIADVDAIRGLLAQNSRLGTLPFETDILRQPGGVEGIEEGRHAFGIGASTDEHVLIGLMRLERGQELEWRFDESDRLHQFRHTLLHRGGPSRGFRS